VADHRLVRRVAQALRLAFRFTLDELARIEARPLQPPPKPLRFSARFAAGHLRRGTVAIQAEGLVVRYGDRRVLDQVTCLLDAEDRVCLTGLNGSGKSTLLRILAGQSQPHTGSVRAQPGIRIGYLPQEPQLPDASGTAATNITLGLSRAGLTSVTAEARGWLVRWGLPTREDLTKRVSDLSVGQQRKIKLGVLVGSNPDVLLLDEPTNHLSFDVTESLQDAINEFQGPVLIVTHDRRLIRHRSACRRDPHHRGRSHPRVQDPRTTQPHPRRNQHNQHQRGPGSRNGPMSRWAGRTSMRTATYWSSVIRSQCV